MTQETGTQTDSSQLLTQNAGTTNVNCVFQGAYYDFSGRPIEEVVRIQHQLSVLQRQYQTQAPSSHQPPSGLSSSTTATGAPPAPSRSASAPLFTGSLIPPPCTPSGSQTQSAVLPTPQNTAGKGKGKKKQSPVEESKEIAKPKRKQVESAIGPSSVKPRSTRLRIESDESDPNYIPGETQIP